MREIRALVWKEWHETRPFLWIAWGLFIGLPIIGGFEGRAMYSHQFEFWASPWILFCGPVLAIVVGVASTCRDLQTKLEDFWQSRPMGSLRLFVVKYFVGLGVVFLACAVPLVIELVSIRDPGDAMSGLSLAFLWMAIFSMAFASGCFFRRASHAAAVAVLGALLIYFLPIVFPPLQRFNVGRLINLFDEMKSWKWDSAWTQPVIDVSAGMLAVALIMAAIALLAVRYRLHIESGKPLIYGAASMAFLILLESASYQLGTNLPILSSVGLPEGQQARRVAANGTSGTAILQLWYPATDPRGYVQAQEGHWQFFSRPFSVADNRLVLGPERALSEAQVYPLSDWQAARNERDPSVIYRVQDLSEDNEHLVMTLTVLSDASGVPTAQGSPIELWGGPSMGTLYGFAHVWHDRLFVVGQRTMVFDVSDPLQPKRLSDEPIRWTRQQSVYANEQPTIDLPPTPGMPATERLKFALSCYQYVDYRDVFDGMIWCRLLEQSTPQGYREPVLEVVRLKSLTEDSAQFELVAKYSPTLVQRMFSGQYFNSLKMKNGLLYASQYNTADVFDLTGPKPLRLIAHFAAPGLSEIEPLDDGRAIAAGQKLWLLGPPPKR